MYGLSPIQEIFLEAFQELTGLNILKDIEEVPSIIQTFDLFIS